jgi:hypothetical protein
MHAAIILALMSADFSSAAVTAVLHLQAWATHVLLG